MNLTRAARNTAAGSVASIAAYASYWHTVAVATRYGERSELAYVYPFSVDGMMVVASIAMVDARRAGRKPGRLTTLAMVVGIVASLASNIASAHPSPGGWLVAAWPPVALLLVVEMLSRPGAHVPARAPAEPVPSVVMEPVVEPKVSQSGRRPAREHVALARQILHEHPDASHKTVAERLGISEARWRVIRREIGDRLAGETVTA
jgi:hypothetical protein